MADAHRVYIVDDDEAVRESLSWLIGSIGIQVEKFDSAAAFLAHHEPSMSGCLVLDVRMPGMSGLDLQERLNEMGSVLPVVVVTGHGDISMAVRAMKAGAVDFIEKPFNDQVLLDTIQTALARGDAELRRQERLESVRQRLDQLTDREQEVLYTVLDGKTNKVIALELGISEKTVEVHRARIMRKMEVRSVAELVKCVLHGRSRIDY